MVGLILSNHPESDLADLLFSPTALASYTGLHTKTSVQLQVQEWYFAFLFIQVFFLVSVATGATGVIELVIDNPAQVPNILAKKIPSASNFFFSYLLLQAFGISGGALIQVVRLFLL